MGHVLALLEAGQGGDLNGLKGRRRRVLATMLPLARVEGALWWRIRQHCECRVEFGMGVVVVDVELPHSTGVLVDVGSETGEFCQYHCLSSS